MSHDDHGSHVNYLYVFGALCVFTLISVLSDLPQFRPGNHIVLIVVVMAIASAKASCVMLFFMHLKFEGNWKFVLLAPTTILAIGLPLALLPDIGMHYYVDTAPQSTAVIEHDEHGEDGAEHEEHESDH